MIKILLKTLFSIGLSFVVLGVCGAFAMTAMAPPELRERLDDSFLGYSLEAKAWVSKVMGPLLGQNGRQAPIDPDKIMFHDHSSPEWQNRGSQNQGIARFDDGKGEGFKELGEAEGKSFSKTGQGFKGPSYTSGVRVRPNYGRNTSRARASKGSRMSSTASRTKRKMKTGKTCSTR